MIVASLIILHMLVVFDSGFYIFRNSEKFLFGLKIVEYFVILQIYGLFNRRLCIRVPSSRGIHIKVSFSFLEMA